jgi:hypothetical protein
MQIRKDVIMDQRSGIVFVGIAIAIVAGLAVWLYVRQRRSKLLRERFGPEYDRVISQEGDRRRAEGVLEFREKKRESLKIRPLSEANRQAYSNRWNNVQAQFVDDPEGAVAEANQLINEIMQERGYPVGNFEELADVISVDHPVVVDNYRSAHAIAVGRTAGQTTTEGLRKAMVHYRSLFEELIRDSQAERKELRA